MKKHKELNMQRVLVTGSTGFIGWEVARLLAEEGMHPRLLVRRMQRGILVSPLDAEPVNGDLSSPSSLQRAVQGVDTVIHLAARASFEAYRYVKPSIVDGSANLMDAAVRAGVRCFVYASSLLVYSDQREPIDRKTPVRPISDYGRAKVEAERVLLGKAQDAGVAFCAIRLPHVYGARDAVFETIRRGMLLVPGRGLNVYAHLHVRDAARSLVECARQRFQGIIPVADDEPATWREFFDVVKRYYPTFRKLSVPSPLSMAGALFLQTMAHLRGWQTLETPAGVRSWNLNLPVRKGLLWEELGIKPRYATIHEGIPAVLDDCVAYRWIHPLHDHR